MTTDPVKIKIVKCSFDGMWYSDKIGQEFEVDKSWHDSYTVKDGDKNDKVVLYSDCEVVAKKEDFRMTEDNGIIMNNLEKTNELIDLIMSTDPSLFVLSDDGTEAELVVSDIKAVFGYRKSRYGSTMHWFLSLNQDILKSDRLEDVSKKLKEINTFRFKKHQSDISGRITNFIEGLKEINKKQ